MTRRAGDASVRPPVYGALVLATLSTGAGWAVIGGAVVLLWVVPSIFVSAVAAGEDFRAPGVFVAALFLSWPFVLLVVITLGGRSPLVRALKADDLEPSDL
jgi:hypothetical protein